MIAAGVEGFLVALPFGATAVLTALQFMQLWRPPANEEPTGWQTAVIAPTVVAGLVPLTLAVHANGDPLAYAIYVDVACSEVVALAIVVVTLQGGYFEMAEPVRLGRRGVARYRLVLGLILLTMLSGAVISIGASARS